MDEKVVATIPPEVIRRTDDTVYVDDLICDNPKLICSNPEFCVMLTKEEATLVRKILQCANQMFTVADIDFHENKLDLLIRKLRRYEE